MTKSDLTPLKLTENLLSVHTKWDKLQQWRDLKKPHEVISVYTSPDIKVSKKTRTFWSKADIRFQEPLP